MHISLIDAMPYALVPMPFSIIAITGNDMSNEDNEVHADR